MSAEEYDSQQSRAQWSSEPAFIFSMAAAAVGLGNIWRFPYMVGENGGGAFILAYLICVVVVALPLMLLEVSAGRLQKGNVVRTFARIGRAGQAYGWLVVLLTVMITSYYLVITGWTLGYAISALRFSVQPFDDFTSGYNSVWFFLAVTVAATALLIKGVGAIERYANVMMPLLLLMILTVAGIGMTMQGWAEARAFMFEPDMARLAEPGLWFAALGQAFFTLAIGQGYLITYGSFIPAKTHVPRASLTVAGFETGVALLAGAMIFPFVFTYGFDPGTGSQLAFDTLPRVFEEMPSGAWLAILFFGLFFAAAFSPCLAGLKVIIAAISEEFGMSHRRAVVGVGMLMVLLGLPSALSFSPIALTIAGEPVLDYVDRVGGTNTVIASSVIGAGLFCWLVPRPQISDALGARSRWWSMRIYIVGRTLPFVVAAALIWRVVV